MEKEFDVQEIIELPNNTIKKAIDNYFVILAPEYPNWIVLDDIEYFLYQELESKKNIMESMEYVFSENCNSIDEELVIDRMTSLLTKIYETNFFQDVEISEEEPIEKIKKSVHINLTNDCNMRCVHCYMSAGMLEEQRLDFEKIVAKIEEINEEIGYTNVVISGGEPLVYPEIIDLLNKLSKNYITLFTNGTLITEENYENICDNCKEIQISFEGLTEEAYEQVRGKGNYSKVKKAIELIKRKNVRLILAITILPSNLNNIQQHLKSFIESLAYDNLEVRLNSEIEMSGNALNLDLKKYNKKDADELIIELMKELNDIGISIEFNSGRNTHFQNCGIGANIVINYDVLNIPI